MAATTPTRARTKFFVEVIKPSHYDDDGYVIQWLRSYVPSSSLACVTAIAEDAAARNVLGDDVEIIINPVDELHTLVKPAKIIQRMKAGGGRGLIMLTGVQSNQFPRAADLAAEFRAAGLDVAIGGFHVSGCISMLPQLPPEIQAVKDLGVTLFAGEAEMRLDMLFQDAYHGRMKPVYNYLLDLPDLENQVAPFLPFNVTKRNFNFTAFDAGRGCPFRCSFCTIINVQGRKSRHRTADDVERIVRQYHEHGVRHLFITDDNMARNKNWEPIFDRLIELREKEGIRFKIFIQVDTQCHKITNFVEKAARAGVNRAFIGMESISPENLAAAKKFQNRISEYRTLLQAWRAHKVITYAGYILGFPADTPETIERDIKTLQREVAVDIVEFFIMTPLPGSADHQQLAAQGVPMDPDMNRYDTEHVTTAHPKMSAETWRTIYEKAWHLYYSPEHIETMLRRAEVSGGSSQKLVDAIALYYGSQRFEKMHPLQCGLFRRKMRNTRRPTFPRENPLVFYAKYVWESLTKYAGFAKFYWELKRIRSKIRSEANYKQYTDVALTPVVEEPIEAECGTCCGEGHDHHHDDGPAVVPLTIPLPKAKPAAAVATKAA
jgi:radical SAM superfamily enzyme YgiQ (UPF0313 family)